jgi:hypothetical protein
MNYLEALYEFTLEFEPLYEIDYSHHNIVFLGASSILGFIVIILDIIAYNLKGKSILELKYNKETKYLQVILFWTNCLYNRKLCWINNENIQFNNSIVRYCRVCMDFSRRQKLHHKSVEPEIEQK